MFIGKIDVRPRQKILVTIREEKKMKMIDVRVHNTSDDGEMVATPAGISLSEEQVDQAIELLKEAKLRVAGQKQERDDPIKGDVATRDNAKEGT
jgi:hypothetical protein